MKYRHGVKVHFHRIYKGVSPSDELTIDSAIKKGRYTWLTLISNSGAILKNVPFKKIRIVK